MSHKKPTLEQWYRKYNIVNNEFILMLEGEEKKILKYVKVMKSKFYLLCVTPRYFCSQTQMTRLKKNVKIKIEITQKSLFQLLLLSAYTLLTHGWHVV